MNKAEYRMYFVEVQKYIKLTIIFNEIGEGYSNFSKFLKGSEFDFLMSTSKLENIKQQVTRQIYMLLQLSTNIT